MARSSSGHDDGDIAAEVNEPAPVEKGIARSHSLDVTDGSPEISTLCHQCLATYQELSESIRGLDPDEAEGRGFNRDEKLVATQDSKSRLKAWAVNIAALQKKHHQSSLDFRLKDATEIRQRIIKILKELAQTLDNASSIVTGNRKNRTWKVGYISDSEDEDEDEDEDDILDEFLETSELDQLFSTMNATNTNLMKLSVIIRDSPTRDDYLKAASRYRFDPQYDIGHVHEKYGSAKRSKDWLVERLGKSITRRRQFLKYRAEHHGKLARDWDAPEEEIKPEKTIAMTKATTFVETKAVVTFEKPDGSEAGGSFGSQTSYDQTVMGETAVGKLTIPPPPVMAFEGVTFQYGEYFQCPYCYTEQKVKNRAAWKKHVFRDLRPYVCTFKECNMRMFRSRNEWFTHELQSHRRQWICVLCTGLFTSKTTFSIHLASSHHVAESDPQLSALILQSEESVDIISSSACPFCDEWEENMLDPKQDAKRAFLNDNKNVKPYGTLKQFRRHLGRHMEQLALFALPMAESEDLEDDSAGENSDDNASIKSGDFNLDEPVEEELDNPSLTKSRTKGLAEVIISRKEDLPISNIIEANILAQRPETNSDPELLEALKMSVLDEFSRCFREACQPLKENFVKTSHHVIGKLSLDIFNSDNVFQLPLVKMFVSGVDLKYEKIRREFPLTMEKIGILDAYQGGEDNDANALGGALERQISEESTLEQLGENSHQPTQKEYGPDPPFSTERHQKSPEAIDLPPSPPQYNTEYSPPLQSIKQEPDYFSSQLSHGDANTHWTMSRVLLWLANNQFSMDWQETFKTLNIYGNIFLDLGSGNGGRGDFLMMHQQVYPRLAKECSNSGTGWDQAREREEGKRLRRLIRGIVTGKTSYNSPPSILKERPLRRAGEDAQDIALPTPRPDIPKRTTEKVSEFEFEVEDLAKTLNDRRNDLLENMAEAEHSKKNNGKTRQHSRACEDCKRRKVKCTHLEQHNMELNEYFIPGEGIDKEVIAADICRYLGNNALVRNSQTGSTTQGYFITAYRNLTSAMIADLKADTQRWYEERQSRGEVGYESSQAREWRKNNGSSDFNVVSRTSSMDFSLTGKEDIESTPEPETIKMKVLDDKDRHVTLRRLTEEEVAAERKARTERGRRRANSVSSLSDTDTTASRERFHRDEREAERRAESLGSLISTSDKIERAIASVSNSGNTVSEAPLPPYNQLQTSKEALIDLRESRGSNEEELKPSEESQAIQANSQPRDKGKGVQGDVSLTTASNPIKRGLKSAGSEENTDDREKLVDLAEDVCTRLEEGDKQDPPRLKQHAFDFVSSSMFNRKFPERVSRSPSPSLRPRRELLERVPRSSSHVLYERIPLLPSHKLFERVSRSPSPPPPSHELFERIPRSPSHKLFERVSRSPSPPLPLRRELLERAPRSPSPTPQFRTP